VLGAVEGLMKKNEHRTSNVQRPTSNEKQTSSPEDSASISVSLSFPFNVGRWTFDVGRSSFKTIPYDVNVTHECLQNNLALMGHSAESIG
jgi:hypothetical protein